MDILTTLFIIYSAVLLTNAVLAGVCLYYYRDPLYRLSLFLWLASLFNSVAQGIFQAPPLSVLAFSSDFVCAMILVRILASVTGLKVPSPQYIVVMLGGLATSFTVVWFGGAFKWIALPVAIGIALPQIHTALKVFASRDPRCGGFGRFYAGILAINGLHFLDYPFLRMNEAFAVPGFSMALIILMALSLLLPAFIAKNIADRHAATLEEQVRERTKELKEANIKLEKITAENKYLLAVVCHDISSPLTLVSIGLDMFSDPEVCVVTDPFQIKTLGQMRKGLATVQEILSYVKNLQSIRDGKARLGLGPIALKDVLEEINTLVFDALAKKGLRMTVEGLEHGTQVLAERSTLKNQILQNLISNAIKFSHPGSEIKVRIQEVADRVLLTVKDSGIGMPRELAEQIFNPRSATSRLGTAGEKGTGFGMPIVKACMDQYGAEIRCESFPESENSQEHGTVFTLIFKKAHAIANSPRANAS
jgi:signal transduction histidine kinase